MKKSTEILLRELAEKLGTTTEKLYIVLVQQAKAEIIKSTISICINIAIVTCLIIAVNQVHFDDGVYKTIHHNQFDYQLTSERDTWPIGNFYFIGIWLISLISTAIIIADTKSDIDSIIDNKTNPEYGAIQELLDILR